VRSALLGDHESALELLDTAALHVPRALLLDQVKIRMNKTMIQLAARTIDRRDADRLLRECIERVRGVQMPYLSTVLKENVAAIGGEHSPRAHALSNECVSLAVSLDTDASPASNVTSTLLMSVHWRY
jgi:hypothetical protein